MQNVNLNEWHRATPYHFFKHQDDPHFGWCADVDVTALKSYTQKKKLPFFLSTVYCITHTVQKIPELKYRIRGEDEVILHEVIHPSFTTPALHQLFSFCTLEYDENPAHFFKKGIPKIEHLKNSPANLSEAPRDDVIYMTCIPWVKFSSFYFGNHQPKMDSIPRFAWGKVELQSNKMIMPLAVQLHHALADGLHLGTFYDLFQETLSHPENLL